MGSPQNPKSYLPATTPTAGAGRRTPFAASSSTTARSGGRVNPDDYHSTLRALNSKRCMLRKSLGQVLNKDFIKCHVSSHMMSLLKSIEKSDSNSQPSKVVSNIPFNISTNIIKQLLPMGDVFSEVLLLQILISNSESQGQTFFLGLM